MHVATQGRSGLSASTWRRLRYRTGRGGAVGSGAGRRGARADSNLDNIGKPRSVGCKRAEDGWPRDGG
jgi:hypothetical protein